ncbi:MAG: glycosyltransferase family 2 protein, partial [Planktomarina sp.]
MTMPDASVPTISVIVVSQGRPDALALCLLSLSQQLDAPDFEVIVVGDDDAHKASLQYPAITFVLDETPNISILRNVGINHASGDVLAFIDDDAVAGPFWLQQLFNAFDGDQISCVGGHVFGPDGVTLQWPDRIIHTDGSCTSFEPDDPKCVYAPKDRALKLEGTNMAFRRSVFEVVGLFDPSFAFYLDETDLCWRSYQAGLKSRINPAAWVVHGYEKGPRRNAERIPKSLYALGFSLAVFLRKHKPADCHLAIFDEFRAEQRVRVLRWMVRGG